MYRNTSIAYKFSSQERLTTYMKNYTIYYKNLLEAKIEPNRAYYKNTAIKIMT